MARTGQEPHFGVDCCLPWVLQTCFVNSPASVITDGKPVVGLAPPTVFGGVGADIVMESTSHRGPKKEKIGELTALTWLLGLLQRIVLLRVFVRNEVSHARVC